MRLFSLLFRLLGLILSPLLAPFAGIVDRIIHAERHDAFRDHDRRRTIPYRLYEPEGVEGPAPVVIFSHGLGGTRDAAPYLGRALAAAGYWGVFLQHPGSDRGVFRDLRGAGSQDQAMMQLRQSMMDPRNMRDRFLDLPFVLDRLTEMTAPGGRFAGRFDLDRVGMAGHSYGARSTMAAVGQRLPGPGTAFHEPRIRAGVVLSPSGTRMPGMAEMQNPAADYAGIEVPLLHVTGTNDTDPDLRVLPYRMIRAPEQYLLVLDGASHGDFSAARLPGQEGQPITPVRARTTRLVALAAVLFFDAYLKGSGAARTALRQEFPGQLTPADRFEFK